MKLKRILIIIIIVSIALGINYFFINSKNTSEITFNLERVINKKFVVLDEFQINKRFSRIQEYGEHLFLAEQGNQKIYKLRKDNGVIEEVYGNKGSGPKENELIMSFEVDSTGYFTIDARKQTLQKVSFNDSLLFFHKTSDPIERGVKVDSSVFFAKAAEYGPEFSVLDLKRIKKENIKTDEIFSMEKNPSNSFIYDGTLIKGKDHLFFVGYLKGFFICIDAISKKVEYMAEAIYHVPEPKVIALEGGGMSLDRRSMVQCTRGASANENHLYIYTGMSEKTNADKEKKDFFVDVYNVSSGTYAYTIKAPIVEGQVPYMFMCAENRDFYFVYEDYLVRAKETNL